MPNGHIKAKLYNHSARLRGNAATALTLASAKPDESQFHRGKAEAYSHSAQELEALIDEITAMEQGQGDAPNALAANSSDGMNDIAVDPEPAYTR